MRLENSTLLLIEDEALLRRRMAAQFESLGADVSVAADLAEARRLLADLPFDYALIDVNLPDGRSLDLLAEKRFDESTVVVVMTSESGVAGAVEAMQLGAADYLAKPVEVEDAVVRLWGGRRQRRRQRRDGFRQQTQAAAGDSFVFGGALEPVRQQLEKIIGADRRLLETGSPLAPVLIEGETGTGKTTLARWLHHHGPRADGPLVEVNCSALPEALAESELFGHERGAFTDAKEAKMGLMEAADGGTLFLDELPSLPPALQTKLLTAIEDRAVRRVGGRKTIQLDVRIIAATPTHLGELVEQGAFREDLRQRLDLFRVRIPPLRERGDDIVALAEQLIAATARRYGLDVPVIPAPGRGRLLAHPWPGNVRELAHEVERSLVFDDDQLTFSSLVAGPDAADGEHPWLAAGFTFPDEGSFDLEQVIDTLVERALAQADGNVSAAARLLGVPRDYVRYRLKR
jgi:two-component system, NtrC family, response regulator AtoC